MSIGERILELRKQKGLSQQDVADKIGISKAQLSRYEAKGVQPPADCINQLAELFEVSTDFLIKGEADDIAQKSIHNTELLNQFKRVSALPDYEQKTILKVVKALICEYDVRQAYAGQ